MHAAGVLRSHKVGGIDAVHYLLLPGDHLPQRVLIMKLLHLLGRKNSQQLIVLIAPGFKN